MRTSLFCFVGDGGGRSPVEAYLDEVRSARDEGFAAVWTSQLPHEADLPTLLAVALREVDGIALGTAVLPIQVRHPMVLAQTALTLDLISPGRLRLGIGLSHAMVSEGMWGIPFDRPARRVAEYLDVLLPLLAGEEAAASGETVSGKGRLQIPGAGGPPVYLAALGPRLLEIAGSRTAGTVTWMTGPKTLAGHTVPTLRRAAEAAGRTAEVIVGLPVCVTDDEAAARKLARRQFAIYGRLPSYRAMLDREGYAGPEDAAIVGDEAAVRERLDELAAVGVDELTAVVFGAGEDRGRTRAFLRGRA